MTHVHHGVYGALVLVPELLLLSPNRPAPWARPLDNLQLWTSVCTAPWAAPDGFRIAALEHVMSSMASGAHLGPVYFQRVSRTVGDLVDSGILHALGVARARRYSLTPEGFAAVVLNMSACIADPTIAGDAFESRRVLAESQPALFELLDGTSVAVPPKLARFFARVDAVELLGQRVMTREVVAEAFSVHALVLRQIAHVSRLRAGAVTEVERTRMTIGANPDPRAMQQALVEAFGGAASGFSLDALQIASRLASGPAVMRAAEANVFRYDHALAYLERLREFYSTSAPDLRSLVGENSPSAPPTKRPGRKRSRQ